MLVLVANRGEVANRIIRTCTNKGIKTVSVFTSVDSLSPHARNATFSVFLGDDPRSYTDADAILKVALEHNCTALHPGYGFLSENEAFCDAVNAAGIIWLGPTCKTIRDFSLKHVARAMASHAGVPVASGSSVLQDAIEAVAAADRVGYPVLLKATGGGGGMGIFICRNSEDVLRNFETSQHQGQAFFGNSGVFVEKYIEQAHHVEVQIFGDGEGGCIHLGERECSIQRRHQKVLEESPAPLLDEELRDKLTSAAVALGKLSNYRSAGTVEFLVDKTTREFFFLEVNTRLQVEHGITEMVHGDIDIVYAQLVLQLPQLQGNGWRPSDLLQELASANKTGWAIEVRINGEDPAHNFRPCPGQLGHVAFPPNSDGVRVDTWIETGTVVSPHYDSLLAKLMVYAPTRKEAIQKMTQALKQTSIQGAPNNLEFLRALVADPKFQEGRTSTRFLETFNFMPHVMEVITPGLQCSVQDWPGRVGLWHVGVPPSGPMDALGHRLANAMVGNDEKAAGLEFSLQGPTLKFHTSALVALAGTPFLNTTLDKKPVKWFSSFKVEAGQVLKIGQAGQGCGVRGYLAVRGGIDVPMYLGSRSTFPSGQFGGYQGRYLKAGDSLPIATAHQPELSNCNTTVKELVPIDLMATASELLQPLQAATGSGSPESIASSAASQLLQPPGVLGNAAAGASSAAAAAAAEPVCWEVGVLPGPHADPDFFTTDYIEQVFYKQHFKVHHNSNRLGVRLVGKQLPQWTRVDGGEGGSHPSNVHDHIYAIGAINFTGDHPVVLTQDGPSLGGFVCAATIVSSELWKLGQVRPDDEVKFVKLSLEEAYTKRVYMDNLIASVCEAVQGTASSVAAALSTKSAGMIVPEMPGTLSVLKRTPSSEDRPSVEYRLAGDRYIQVEYGPMELDLSLRVRVHCLQRKIKDTAMPGVLETSPGVRSLMIEYDVRKIPTKSLLLALEGLEVELEDVRNIKLPSRIVRLPLAFDERWSRDAVDRYMRSIRSDAPYLPSNIDYIAANNGLSSRDEVKKIVFDSSYLVLGLGDVYLGAPCAVPMDPRHRLVTAKYNPARTFTAEGTVGIGGTYMCIYPMDSPGGYQLIGRTLPIWNTFGRSGPFNASKPWMLDFFDQVRFYEVSEDELEDMRAKFSGGRLEIKIEDASFSLEEYQKAISGLDEEVNAFKVKQLPAMSQQLRLEAESLQRLEEATARAAAESQYLGQNGSLSTGATAVAVGLKEDADYDDFVPGAVKVHAPFTASVLDIKVSVGDAVTAGQTLIVLEAMKMEVPLVCPVDGKVVAIPVKVAQLRDVGAVLLVVIEDS